MSSFYQRLLGFFGVSDGTPSSTEIVNNFLGTLSEKERNEVMRTLSQEFQKEMVERKIPNSIQHSQLISELEKILTKAEEQLKTKFWIRYQNGQFPPKRSINISLVAHEQDRRTCYAFATTTVVRAALNRLQGFPTPTQQQLCEEIIKEFKTEGGDPKEVLKFLQGRYPIRWETKDAKQAQEILKAERNPRPYIAAFFFCGVNWEIFSDLVSNHPSKVMKKSDFPCKSLCCSEPSHNDESRNLEFGGHAVVLKDFKYQDSKKVWKIKNSWGETRGDKGYFFIESDAIQFWELIDVFYVCDDLKEHHRDPHKITISGETYEYYETDCLGESVSANVYEARKSGEKYAIKIIEKNKISAWESAMKEIKAHESFKQDAHPNIVKFIASEEINDKLYIVLQYHGPESLNQKVDEGLVFPIHTGLRSVKDMAQGLARIHSRSGGIHGDIHTGNILFDQEKCCITDFGKTTFSDDREKEKSAIRAAMPRNLLTMKKLLYFLLIPFYLLAALFFPWLSGWQGFKSYFLCFVNFLGSISLLMAFDKKLKKDQDYLNELKKKVDKLENYGAENDIYDLAKKVVLPMMLGNGFQNLKDDEIVKKLEEDLTVVPLKNLIRKMLDREPKNRSTAKEIEEYVSKLILEEDQIYRHPIMTVFQERKWAREYLYDAEVQTIIGIASRCLYNRILNESSLA